MEFNFDLWHTTGMSDTTIGALIRRQRRAAKLTQEELGSEIRRTGRTVSEWENNRTIPDRVSLQRLARVFHMRLDELTAYLSDAQLAQIDAIIEATPQSELDIILDDIRTEEDQHPGIARALREWLSGWRARGG